MISLPPESPYGFDLFVKTISVFTGLCSFPQDNIVIMVHFPYGPAVVMVHPLVVMVYLVVHPN